MHPGEALQQLSNESSDLVRSCMRARPPELVGVADEGPVADAIRCVLWSAGADLLGIAHDDEKFREVCQATGFIVRDIRRFGSFVTEAVELAVNKIHNAVELEDRVHVERAARVWAMRALTEAVIRYTEERQAQAGLDHLTQLPRRREFEDAMRRLFDAEREPTPFSLVLIDLDDLKKYNNEGGYAAGDRAIVSLSHNLRDLVREQRGTIYRWGGDEFIVLLPEVSREDASALFSARQEIATYPFSYGVAESPTEAAGPYELWSVAEDRLGRDKAERKSQQQALQSND